MVTITLFDNSDPACQTLTFTHLHVPQDKAFITSAIQSAYKDINIMTNEDKAVEFLEKIVQVRLVDCGAGAHA